jgi:hypothetical protein
MKTGRLLKFHRPGGDVHAYLYQEAEAVRAVLYRFAQGPERAADRGPVHEIRGSSSEAVEAELRAWIDAHYPRTP